MSTARPATDSELASGGRPGAAPPLFALMLLSSAAMGYEVLLTRLFSIIQWHHFAYMMISVALLGYGAAGTFVAVAQRALLPRFDAVFAGGAALFGIAAVAGFALAQRVAFNPLEILWDPQQPLRLVAVYGLLFVPFFCAASSVCLAFTRFAGQPHRIYSFDILGAGAGSVGMLAALYVFPPTDALKLVGALGIAAGALALFRGVPRKRSLAGALLAAAIAAPIVIPADWIRLRPSEYKELSQTLRIDGTRIVAEESSPLGLVTVVESAKVPVPARAGHEPRRDDGTPAAARGVHRRRQPLRADALRWPARAARLPRPAHVGPAIPPAPAATGAGARRRGRSRCAAGDLPRGTQHRRRRAQCAGRRSRGAAVRGLFRRTLQRARRAHPCRRSARLRYRAPRPLRCDPGRAAGRVRCVGGGALRALGKLPVYGRCLGRISAASRAGRPAGDHALGRSASA